MPPSQHTAVTRADATAPPQTGPAGQTPLRAGGGRFRKVDDELEWRCAVCEHWNPVGVTACNVCGSPFGRTLGEPGDAGELRPIEPWAAAAASAVLPGAGHGLLGRRGTATVRAATYLLWLLGGLLLVRAATAAGQTLLPAVPLLGGALALLVTSVHDAYMLADGRSDELLTPRVFFWLVVAVSGALMVSFIPAALRLGSGG
ncbi:MAG: hypothetical protein M3N57_00475 [Actinomycetota bacterium]|nr:hypothetical protein [Actinomycetota bacterium]